MGKQEMETSLQSARHALDFVLPAGAVRVEGAVVVNKTENKQVDQKTPQRILFTLNILKDQSKTIPS